MYTKTYSIYTSTYKVFTSHLVLVTVVAACLFLIGVHLRMDWQPLTADDADFYVAATQWSTHRQLIPHPQLYVHFIQLLLVLFGQSVAVARLAALIPLLLTVCLIPWLVQLVYPNTSSSYRRATAVLSIWLYAISPLTVQNTVLLDTDSSMLVLVLVALLCFWFASDAMHRVLRSIALGAWFTFCLWFKLTTPPMALTAIFVHSLLRGKWADAATAISIGVLGFSAFVATHAFYSEFTGYTLADSMVGLTGRLGNGTGAQLDIEVIAQSAGVFLLWIGIFTGLLFGVSVIQSIRRYVLRSADPQDMLTLYSLLVIVLYSLLIVPAWGYPRYQSPAIPTMAIVVAALIVGMSEQATRFRTFALGLTTASLTAVLLFTFSGDYLYPIYESTFTTVNAQNRLQVAIYSFATPLFIMATIGGGSLLLAQLWKERWVPALSIIIAAMIIGAYIALNTVQINADYSTRFRYTYRYADRQAAIDSVVDAVPEGGVVLADKDVLWYVDRAGEQVYAYLQPAAFRARLAASRVDALIWTEKEWMKSRLKDDLESVALLQRCFTTRQFGIFFVAVRNTNCPELP